MSSIPNPEEVWMKSSVTEEELEKMVEDQVLPAKDLVGWRAASGELFPIADTEEIVAFTSSFTWDFCCRPPLSFVVFFISMGLSWSTLTPIPFFKFLPSF